MQERNPRKPTNKRKKDESKVHDCAKASEELGKLKVKLSESEQWYRTVFEYTGTAMLVIDEDTTILMANHKLEEITGYAFEESLKRRKWTEVVVPEDVDRMLEYHRKRRHDPESVPDEYEFRLIDRNGEKRDMLLSVTIIPGTGKSLVSLVDMTGVKRSQKALLESEKKYRDLFENATDIIYTTDIDGNFTSANKTAMKTYGYREADILNTNIRELIDPSFLSLALEKMSTKISLDSSTRYELLTHTKDRRDVWVEVHTRLVCNDKRPIGIQGIARDITERKMYEEQLQESILRFREMADLLPGIICEIDLSMKLTYANELGLNFFGYTHEDFKKGISVLDLIPEGDRDRFLQDVYNVTHGEFGSPKLYEMLRKDGEKLQLIVNSSPIQKNETITGIRSCLIEISDRVRAEEKLRESEERFRAIYTASPIGIALFDHQGKIIDKNDSFSRMISIGSGSDQSGYMFTIAAIDEITKDNLRRGNPVNAETPQLSAGKNETGDQRWFEWHITPIRAPGNASSMYLAQVQDITFRRQTHEAHIEKERKAKARAEALVAGLQRELQDYTRFRNIVSRSPEMKQIFDIMPEVSLAAVTVLVMGDSGTGKELIARSIHELSNRKDKPFIAINCSALPDTLLESELFGYKAGAFTDAKKDKPGRFALAEGGTIFLDEIGDISPAMQVKLLRVLQEHVYEPLGSTASVKADIRVIVATNKNLSKMVSKGEFREDLFYRINVVTIQLPALRERRGDIPLLCTHFIDRCNIRYNKKIRGLTDAALQVLMAHDFPGNIRELENVIEHAFIFCKDDAIDINHLPVKIRNKGEHSEAAILSSIKSLGELERLYIKSIFNECNKNMEATADRLGIHKTTLFRKMKHVGM